MEALSLIIAVLVLMFLAMPVPFALITAAVGFILVLQLSPEAGIFAAGVRIVVQRVAPSLESFPLLAIPLFVLAGNLLNVSGIADRIFLFARKAVGHIHGGLAHVNVFASVIFAGMSGVAQADAAGLGTIEIKAMRQAGFSPAFSAAVTASSAIIGPIIPPSVIMVIYAVLSGTSIGELFLAGIIPGISLALVLMILVYVLTLTGRVAAPPPEPMDIGGFGSSFVAALPGLLAPVILVGGLVTGVATPTELGAIVVAYALGVGLVYREMTFASVLEALKETVRITGAMVFIIACAAPISWLISVLNVPQQFASALFSITENPIIILLIINVILLLAGLFLETTAVLLIGVPALLPIAAAIGIHPTQFGVMVVFNLLIGAITPPFGVILFIMMDIAKIRYGEMVRAMIPFYGPILFVLLAITFVPQVTMWLPEFVAALQGN
jgi:tripartite ATP-independent transporter DctM subunit